MYAVVAEAYTRQVYVDRAFQRKTNEQVRKHATSSPIAAVTDFVAINAETIEALHCKLLRLQIRRGPVVLRKQMAAEAIKQQRGAGHKAGTTAGQATALRYGGGRKRSLASAVSVQVALA